MTRKDYNLIAEAIRSAAVGGYDSDAHPYSVARTIAYALRRDNPRFETARFMDACGFSATD